MKKILLVISSLFLVTGCGTYTVKVETNGVTINGQEIDNGKCEKYSDGFFGLAGGDFPLEIQIGDGKTEEKEAGNYVVNSNGVSKSKKCESDNKAGDADKNKEDTETGPENDTSTESDTNTESEESSNKTITNTGDESSTEASNTEETRSIEDAFP